ncbi:dTDP-4-dehydrorhamnose reductase [Candidatus Saccharibacteria bacterium]|nr:dTDP-4-dehydrorhamnose reductase [Candidatus Saccharibacteria bacterium]NIW79900.1 dTDP-4-dehydrorhamnose reductase [Calditrichia bacterium]
MKKILITGVNGLLGQKLMALLAHQFEVVATAKQPSPKLSIPKIPYFKLDITKTRQCRDLIQKVKPDFIINAASFTQVDACEEEKELCWQVNVKGVENLAEAARRTMSLLIHLSTDYLFDGTEGPYEEDHLPRPLGYYGKSKLASENAVRKVGIPYAIVRTNVLYGTGIGVKNNFFLWVYSTLKSDKPINVVTDQYNNPTFVDDLAEGIKLLIEGSRYGLYNIAGKEYVNRYDFAQKLARTFGFSESLIHPLTTDQLQQKAPRPLKGGLKIDRAQKELGYQPRSLVETFRILKAELEAGE